MQIYLVGMPAAGKTVLGKLLAEHLMCPWYDTDRELERLFGKTIPQIFLEDGEPAFRAKEQKMIRTLLTQDELTQDEPLVVSTGGGSFSHKPIREAMCAKGFVIYLKASLKVLMARSLEGRPLLQNKHHQEPFSPWNALKTLLAEREKSYEEAHKTLLVDNKTPQELVRIIKTFLPISWGKPLYETELMVNKLA